ncbi:MAG: glycosyltransferase family 4 protein [Armatimonadetes bacterium]|nr:glycosyltransferase family 4 protein [Armatimonadota bacterium]
MRIGIDARFLTHPQDGGFKTYTENIVHGLASLDRDNEYVLYTDRRARIDVAGDNFEIKIVGGPAMLREQVFLPAIVERDDLDAVHFPCNTGPVLQPCAMVLTIHDIIPCLRKAWTAGGGLKQRALSRYWQTVIPAAARKARRVITISQSSKSDICGYLGVPEDKITVIPTGLHPDFRVMTSTVASQRVRHTYQLPDRFILGFVSSDPRKNAGVLIHAARIVMDRMRGTGLVLVCSSDRAQKLAVEHAMRYRPWPALPVLLDPLPRQDLVVIYNMAEALAFPSLYEGFGLPVIEAMACGTPVVTSNVSSLPEVAGDGAVLVNPNDPGAVADGLIAVLADTALRESLVQRGLERARLFNWRRTVEETIAVYEGLLSPAGNDAGGHLAESRLAGGGAL